MTIRTLFDSIPDTDILGIRYPDLLSAACAEPRRDSRLVGAGDVFFCIRGKTHDGHSAIPTAAARGAVCVVIDDPDAISTAEECGIAWILVRDTASLFLPACLAFYGHPERTVQLYAVTGTNGKTSVTYLLEAIFSAYAPTAPCAVFGTVENRIAGIAYRTEHTTPAPEITAMLLSKARDASVKTVILEASSHALSQKRLSGLHFSCGIFTNLSEDHLDYHTSMEDYFLAKRQLFFACDRAVINIDDPNGMRLYRDPALPCRRYSFSPSDGEADFPLSVLPQTQTDTCFDFVAANRLAAAACAMTAGIPTADITAAIRSMKPIPGRMECLRTAPFSVYLDYAHTPDALFRALSGLRKTHPVGRLSVVFGCGGDREQPKRPLMGKIAAEHADRIILTADNSRSECVHDILAQIIGGIPRTKRHKVTVIEDRTDAVRQALSDANAGDTVLFAGKGHETCQTDRSGTHPFSERDIIQQWFNENNT